MDTYKESLWDKFGFDSVEQRENLSALAKELFCKDIDKAIKSFSYDYILIEYVFTEKHWKEFWGNVDIQGADVKTIYLKPTDFYEHEKVWESRSRNFSVRHPGHGATYYHDGVGGGYTNKYDGKVFTSLPTVGETLEVDITFNPYTRSVQYESILDFIKN